MVQNNYNFEWFLKTPYKYFPNTRMQYPHHTFSHNEDLSQNLCLYSDGPFNLQQHNSVNLCNPLNKFRSWRSWSRAQSLWGLHLHLHLILSFIHFSKLIFEFYIYIYRIWKWITLIRGQMFLVGIRRIGLDLEDPHLQAHTRMKRDSLNN